MTKHITLTANNLSCSRQQQKLFADISFNLAAGELLLVEGANGVGKSSLLRLLAGLAAPDAGDVLWGGKSIYVDAADYHDESHYVGHTNGLKLELSVIENLRLMWVLQGGSALRDGALRDELLRSSPQDSLLRANGEKDVFDIALSTLNLTRHLHTPAKQLSAGQKRRLALAKLWLIPKKLWILDEPLTALDHDMQTIFIDAAIEHLHAGGMIVMSSHQPMQLSNMSAKHLRIGG